MAFILKAKPALDPASTTILVTGASGYIGGHVVNEALVLGYNVVGTARSQKKCEAAEKVFNNPKFSTRVVTDLFSPKPGELVQAMKGVDVIIHVASDMTFGTNVNQIVDGVVSAVGHVLQAANETPTVKRFVLTSSSAAVLFPKPNEEITVSKETWNEEAMKLAYEKDPEPFSVYACSKTKGERAMWDFVREKKPEFVCNAVLPNFNMGKVLPGASEGTTAKMIVSLYKEGARDLLPAQWAIDVVDNARLHIIAGVLDDSLSNDRILAFSEPFNWNDLVDAVAEARPNETPKAHKDAKEGRDLSKIPNEQGAQLLKKWYGQDGYKSVRQSVKENLEHV